ncbi:phosphodiester glycosidase family protein [Candidatus Oscillochloris fontis]|uniref:phosphodiester glycosidase family protein n=1 Tax=Candidatus Oscillochloris fontis TaxID=2496868 RepID=UPI00101CC138|nr:phosphodiester glycosidase family protein [Candidatus Oscillochloris fontis]
MRSFLFLCILMLVLNGCSAPPSTPIPVTTLMPTATAAPAPPEAPSGIPSDSGWQSVQPGVEMRRLRLSLAGSNPVLIHVLRFDPAVVRFQVGYAPDAPKTIGRWIEEQDAIAAINGGFFDPENRTVALLIMAGQPVGTSYTGRGGMFAVDQANQVQVRGLAQQPYDPSEPLVEALQGWPLLVQPGGMAAYSYEDDERARRSAIALDRAGRVLFIAVPSTRFTLAEFSAWLAQSDLEIEAAINLDGGSSTGMMLRTRNLSDRIDAFVPLPIVLLVLPRA